MRARSLSPPKAIVSSLLHISLLPTLFAADDSESDYGFYEVVTEVMRGFLSAVDNYYDILSLIYLRYLANHVFDPIRMFAAEINL